jgi:hypothetical protein
MPVETVHCVVSGSHVTRITDFEGEVAQLICPEYHEPTGRCRLKLAASAGGPLSRLLERVREASLETRSVDCPLGP